MIYVVEATLEGSAKPIALKLGYTNASTVDERLRALQSMCPLELRVICTLPHDGFVERYIHHHLILKGFRLRGEWYRPDAELLFFVYDLLREKDPFLALSRLVGETPEVHQSRAKPWWEGEHGQELIQFQKGTRKGTALTQLSRSIAEKDKEINGRGGEI